MHLWKTFLDVTLDGKGIESPVSRHTTNNKFHYKNAAITTNRAISKIYGTCRTDDDIFLSVTVA